MLALMETYVNHQGQRRGDHTMRARLKQELQIHESKFFGQKHSMKIPTTFSDKAA